MKIPGVTSRCYHTARKGARLTIMRLCLYLTPELIVAPLAESTKGGIIRELVGRVAEQKDLCNAQELFDAVMAREKTSSTFLPSGIAIPHARIATVSDIVVAMGITQEPTLDDDAQADLTARIFCLFFSPLHEKEFGRHLKLLARISAIFCETEFIEQIVPMTDPKMIFEALQKRERELDEE